MVITVVAWVLVGFIFHIVVVVVVEYWIMLGLYWVAGGAIIVVVMMYYNGIFSRCNHEQVIW